MSFFRTEKSKLWETGPTEISQPWLGYASGDDPTSKRKRGIDDVS